jgi:5'-3' exonuclease
MNRLDVYLIDGTYELFRHYYALPAARDAEGRNVAAVRGVVGSVLGLLNGGVTHVAVATDHVIESFRNALWPATRPVRASSRTCSRSFRCSRRRSPRSACRCGR